VAKCGDGGERAAIQGLKSGHAALAAAAVAGFIADAKDVSGNNVPVTGGKYNGNATTITKALSMAHSTAATGTPPVSTPGTPAGGQTPTPPAAPTPPAGSSSPPSQAGGTPTGPGSTNNGSSSNGSSSNGSSSTGGEASDHHHHHSSFEHVWHHM